MREWRTLGRGITGSVETLRTVVTYHSDVAGIGWMTRHAEESKTVTFLIHECRSRTDEGSMTSSLDASLDDLILAVVKLSWQKVAMVLGKARRLSESRDIETSYDALAARITALCTEGRLEAQGNVSKWRRSEVRVPAKVDHGYPEPHA